MFFFYFCLSKEKKITMNRSTKRRIFFNKYLFHSYIHICFQLVAFVREHLLIYKAFNWKWHKPIKWGTQ